MQKNDRFIEGIFRRHQKGFGFVKVENQEDEIYIAKQDTRGAFSGDKVLVKKKSKSEGEREEGIILKVLEREKDTLVGTFQKNKNFGFVIPDDKSFVEIYLFLKRILERLEIIIKFLYKLLNIHKKVRRQKEKY